MAKALFAVDELSGFIAACALVRPTGIEGMKPKSVRKKLKQPSFAAGVNRDEVRQGAEELGVDFDQHVAFVIEAMGERSEALGRASPSPPTGEARLEDPDRLVIALAVLLAVNTVIVNNQTKEAEVTIEGGDHVARWGRGSRVRAALAAGRPIVLALLLLLAALVGRARPAARPAPPRPHRPARPRRLAAVERLRDRRAGGWRQARSINSASRGGGGRALDGVLGGHRAAQRASQLVDRVVNIGEGPGDSCSVPFVARLAYVPVIGEAMWRLTPSFAIEDGYDRRSPPATTSRRAFRTRPGRRRPPR